MPRPTAPNEVELKLEAAGGDALAQVLRHPALARQEGEILPLRAVYFDTPAADLRRAGASLRVRHDGRDWRQTLKLATEPGPALKRTEWECVIPGPALDLAAFKDLAAREMLAGLALAPAFETRIERSVFHARRGRSRIEIAIDRGEIVSGTASAPVSEVELELKGGVAADLFKLAASLARRAPLWLSTVTKAERGYALVAPEPIHKVKAQAVRLRPDDPAAEAFQTIARACLRHCLDNERVLRERRLAEGVHQMRVAIRRLRAALSLFKDAVTDEHLPSVKRDLKSVAESLGAARDLDVLIESVLRSDGASHSSDAAWQAMIAEAEAQRERAYDTLARDLEPHNLTPRLLRVAGWIEGGPWLTSEDTEAARQRPVADLARDELSRRWRSVRKRAKHVAEMDAETRHRLRIAIKKLRYGMEFFDTLFAADGSRKAHREARRTVENLQDTLGQLNDLAVAAQRTTDEPSEELCARTEKTAQKLIRLAHDQARTMADLKPY